MAANFELNVDKRDTKGTGASRRLRRAGQVPGIIYGADKDPEMVSFKHDKIYHLLENEAFHTSIIDVKSGSDTQQVILRDVQYHAYKQMVLHMDLQRISASEKIHMRVPLHFIGEDVAPGVKLQDGIVSHLMTELDVTCLASNLPEYLEADISELHLHESLHLSDIKLTEGVELTSLFHGGDNLAIVTIAAVRGSIEEEEKEEAEGEEGEEGEASEEEPKEGE
ncbi:MAG: 50S ribosomal protein L25/general stress protein Ctc [Acidiferrobacterales bacterium]